MFFRALVLSAALVLASVHTASACDAKCELQTVIDSNAGIALDKPVTLETLRALAPVKSDRTTTRPNPNFPGKNDTVHALAYDGLFVTAAVTPENMVVVERIQWTGGTFKLPLGLTHKATPAFIEARLGKPDQVKQGTVKNGMALVYLNTEQTQTVTFVIENGGLQAVIWDLTGGD